MYTVILAAMLSGGAQQTQAWHWQRASCHGSCCGGTIVSYGCTGCTGGHGCSGCTGCFGGHGSSWGHFGLFARHHASTGYTVGYTYWASGCYGSSCFGGCYGSGGVGCVGWTGGYAAPPAVGGQSNPMPPSGAVAPPPSGPTDKAPSVPQPLPKVPGVDGGLPAPPKLDTKVSDTPNQGAETYAVATNQARVVVHLPADAKLWVDQVSCPISGTRRSFDTPTLAPGAQYGYTLTVEMPDGVRENRRITMTAGRTTEIEFGAPGVETVRR